MRALGDAFVITCLAVLLACLIVGVVDAMGWLPVATASDPSDPVARVGYSDVYRVETSEVVCYVVEGPRGGGIDCVARVR